MLGTGTSNVTLLADHSERESTVALGGAWLAFVLALCLALPQPPQLLHVAIGSGAGALLITVGLAAASRCRIVPTHSPRQRTVLAALAALAGGALGFVLLTVLVYLAQREPALHARFAGRLTEPAWRPLALGFESSILEEVMFRLFAMSVVAWLVSRLLRNSRVTFVIALALSAVLFGLAHLPAWLAATHTTPGLVGAVLLLNGAGGLLLGWVFWRWGLPYAIICHLLGDIVIQGLGPRFLA